MVVCARLPGVGIVSEGYVAETGVNGVSAVFMGRMDIKISLLCRAREGDFQDFLS